MKKAARIARCIGYGALFVAFLGLAAGLIWWARQPRHEGKTIHWWFAQAHNPASPEHHQEIIKAFRAMNSNAVPFLIEQLKHADEWPEPGLREQFQRKLQTVSWVPVGIKKLFPVVPESAGAFVAFHLLLLMGSDAVSAVPFLEQMIIDHEFSDRFEPFHLLRGFGLKSSNSAPVVGRFMFSTNHSIRDLAVDTLAEIIPPKSPHAALLVQAVEQGHVRAAKGLPILAKLDVDFTSLIPKLGDELCSPGYLHSAALATYKVLNLEREVLLPRFADAMKDLDPRFRAQLLKDLSALGEDANPALDTVIAAMNDPFYYVRAEAAKTLVALSPRGDQARAALEILHSKKDDENSYVAETVQSALKRLEAQL